MIKSIGSEECIGVLDGVQIMCRLDSRAADFAGIYIPLRVIKVEIFVKTVASQTLRATGEN